MREGGEEAARGPLVPSFTLPPSSSLPLGGLGLVPVGGSPRSPSLLPSSLPPSPSASPSLLPHRQTWRAGQSKWQAVTRRRHARISSERGPESVGRREGGWLAWKVDCLAACDIIYTLTSPSSHRRPLVPPFLPSFLPSSVVDGERRRRRR